MSNDKTVKSDSLGGGGKPRGVRPPSRSGATQTVKSDVKGDAPTRFSAETRVFGEDTDTSKQQATPRKVGVAGDQVTRKMTGGKTQLAGYSNDEAELEQTSQDAEVSPRPRPSDIKKANPDPVHGWLVITDGFGKGYSLVIGGGRSAIGRGDDQHIQIDFGDESISREKHCWITYDSRVGKFYLSAGDGRNLCYINDEPVLTSLPMNDRDVILIGETTFTFIAFCGDTFAW